MTYKADGNNNNNNHRKSTFLHFTKPLFFRTCLWSSVWFAALKAGGECVLGRWRRTIRVKCWYNNSKSDISLWFLHQLSLFLRKFVHSITRKWKNSLPTSVQCPDTSGPLGTAVDPTGPLIQYDRNQNPHTDQDDMFDHPSEHHSRIQTYKLRRNQQRTDPHDHRLQEHQFQRRTSRTEFWRTEEPHGPYLSEKLRKFFCLLQTQQHTETTGSRAKDKWRSRAKRSHDHEGHGLSLKMLWVSI